MDKNWVSLRVNGIQHEIAVMPTATLLDLIRDELHLTGTKHACGKGDCGACVVIMDGQAVNSCLVLALQAENAEIITIEGLVKDKFLHPLQAHFPEEWALQCGYCTPGMIMSCYALLLRNPDPTTEDILEAISGNLCRCGSYPSIVQAVRAAAKDLQGVNSSPIRE